MVYNREWSCFLSKNVPRRAGETWLRKEQVMNIAVLVNLIGGGLLSLLGFGVSLALGAGGASVLFGLVGLIIWTGIYVGIGLRQVEQNEYLVIERLGKYYRTLRAGLSVLCLPGLIDRPAENGGIGDFKWHRIDLYEAGNQIDFTDGSAGLRAQVWWKVENTEDKPYERGGPFKWTYSVINTEARIKEIVDGALRVMLQQESIDGASKNLASISTMVRDNEDVAKALREMGAELDSAKGVVITDIILPPEVIKAREETIKGQREASKQYEQGGGYAKAIMAIQAEFAKGRLNNPLKPDEGWMVEPQKISFEEARSIYERQRGFETIATKPGNTSFVTQGIAGMQLAIGGEDSSKGGKTWARCN